MAAPTVDGSFFQALDDPSCGTADGDASLANLIRQLFEEGSGRSFMSNALVQLADDLEALKHAVHGELPEREIQQRLTAMENRVRVLAELNERRERLAADASPAAPLAEGGA